MAEVHQRQAGGTQESHVWLAADYHFPSTYSCRIPMSSMNSAPVMPAPGPATVRLALIKAGIECFGLEVVRDQLFPVIRSVAVRIRPPERVAISQQVQRAYKWNVDKRRRTIVQESIIVREMAHASGPMTIFLQVPEDFEQRLRVMLLAVGYWGQTSSLTTCMGVTRTPPDPGECATTLALLDEAVALRPYFSCLATEFRSDQISWYDIVPVEGSQRSDALRLDIYVWPMITDYRHGTNKLLVLTPLVEHVQ
jgi:hypothetical protein